MTAVTVSVVIPTRNRVDSLHRLLRAISLQDRLPEEVIVVDASDHPADVHNLASSYPTLRIVRLHTPPSVCAQRNTGIRRAVGSHVLLCDDDIEPPPDYIRKLADCLQRDSSIGAVTGIWSEVSSERILEHRAPSMRALAFAFLFQQTVWGDIDGARSRWLTAIPLAMLKKWYRHRGNTWSLAGWPLVTHVRTPLIRTAVYSLGAALVRRDWLLASPYDERLSSHGIGDNYGVALGFPGEQSIAVLADLVVRHYKVAENRLDAVATYSQRLLALDYFMRTTGRFSVVNRLFLLWSLVGHAVMFAVSHRADLSGAAVRAFGIIVRGKNPLCSGPRATRPDLSHARSSP